MTPKQKTISDKFEGIYLQKHPQKFDAQRAALLKRLRSSKNPPKKGTSNGN